jgi:hypothetical protein
MRTAPAVVSEQRVGYSAASPLALAGRPNSCCSSESIPFCRSSELMLPSPLLRRVAVVAAQATGPAVMYTFGVAVNGRPPLALALIAVIVSEPY